MNLIRVVVLAAGTFLSQTVAFAAPTEGYWPPLEEIWMDGSSSGHSVQILNDGLLASISLGTAAATMCHIAGKFKPEDSGTFAQQRICVSKGENREVMLGARVVSSNVWVLKTDDGVCSLQPFRLKEDQAALVFDRVLSNECYTVVFQSRP